MLEQETQPTETQPTETPEAPVEETQEPTSEDIKNALLETIPGYQELQEQEKEPEPEPEPVEETQQQEKLPEDDDVSLRKQERDIKKKFRRLNQQMEEFEKQRSEFEAKLKALEEDPVAFLQEKGITLSEWAKKQVETPEIKAMKEIDKLRQELKQKEEAEKAKQAQEQEAMYFEQLQGAIQKEFEVAAEKYTTLSVLLQDNILNKEAFWPYLAADIQAQYDETGEKPDLEVVFQRYEDTFRKLAESLSKVYGSSVKEKAGRSPDVPSNGKAKTPPKQTLPYKSNQIPNTLSNRQVQSSGMETEPQTREELEAAVRRKYGL